MKKLSEQQAQEILEDCIAGNESGWRTLFQHFYPIAQWVAGSKFHLSTEQAKDIAQQTMIDLCSAITANKIRNISGYVRTASHNKCVDYLRKNDPLKPQSISSEDDLDQLSSHVEAPLSYAESEALSVLRQCLQDMKKPCSILLSERYYEEKSYKEVALTLSLPTAQIGVRITRCLEKLKLTLESSQPGLFTELAGLLT